MSFIEDTRYIIDRFENDEAMLEAPDMSIIAVSANILPPEAEEGDILLFTGGGFICLKEETTARKAKIQERFDRLKSNSRK